MPSTLGTFRPMNLSWRFGIYVLNGKFFLTLAERSLARKPSLDYSPVNITLGALCAFARFGLSSFETFVSFVVKILSPRRARSTRSLDHSSRQDAKTAKKAA